MSDISIRPLSRDELQQLLDWAAAEGWNPGLADAVPFYEADPEGFLGCFVDGRMVSGISAVRYADSFGFIGLYITHPDQRGKGYGRAVWDAGMARLEGRVAGLDGVPAQQANYRSMGFEPVYRTWRWEGRLPALPPTTDDIRPAADVDPLTLNLFDGRFFPAGRSSFLEQWVLAPRVAKVLMRGGLMVGLGVARLCRDSYKIGPLFAPDFDGAMALIGALAQEFPDTVLQIDVPEQQEALSRQLDAMGFEKGFVTARMYRGAPPVVEEAGLFAVTTLELG